MIPLMTVITIRELMLNIVKVKILVIKQIPNYFFFFIKMYDYFKSQK